MIAKLREHVDVPMVLDFEALVADYQAGLLNRLRGFGAAASHLDLWVPDEDPLKSIENMLDAAASAGLERLRLALGVATLRRVDREALLSVASAFGVATLRSDGDGALLAIDELQLPESDRAPLTSRVPAEKTEATLSRLEAPVSPEAFPSMLGACYRLAPRAIRHRGLPVGCDGCAVSTAERGGVLLGVTVDASGIVASMRHQGAPTDYAAIVLDVLCDACIGRPVLDVRDHAVARIEAQLRLAGHLTPVAGIVVPETADPVFAWLQAVLRTAVAPLLRGGQDMNDFDPGPRESWLRMDDAMRRRATEVVLSAFARRRGLAPSTFHVVGIELDVRVTVRLEGVSSSTTPGLVLAAERALKRNLEPRLEVFVADSKDRNKKRRLAVVQNGAQQ